MRRNAILIPTRQGPIGAIVHHPERDANGMAVVLAGAGPRFGVNQTLARLSDALATEGILVLRPDHAGRGDSSQVDVAPMDVSPTLEAIRSFRRETGEMDLVLVARCYGILPALELAAQDERVRGVTLLAPGFRKWQRVQKGPDGPVLRRMRVLARRLGWRRFGPPLPFEVIDLLDRAVASTRVSFVLGEYGQPWDHLALEGLPPHLRRQLEVDVVEGTTLTFNTLEEQEAFIGAVGHRALVHFQETART